VLINADATGFDSIRISSTDQGHYSHPLSAAQSREAHREGWKLVVEAAVEDGAVTFLMDNPLDRCRYGAALVHNASSPDSVFCLLHAAPLFRGLEEPLPGPPGARHQRVLVWSPKTGTGELWADGVKRISGDGGAPDFRYALGLCIVAARFRSQRASGILWKARLEIA